MEKCKVLIVMHGAGTGGVEKSLKTLCKYIDRERFQIIVALPSEGPLKNDLDELGLQTIITPLDSWTPIQFFFGERHYYQFLEGLEKRVRTLVDIIVAHGIEIVHSSTLSMADGAFAAKITGKPHIWHIHGKSVGTTNAYGSYLPIETLYSLVNVLSSKLIVVSEDIKKFLGKYIPNDNIHIIYNGIDLEEFDSQLIHSTSIREEFKLNGSQLVTLVGRIAKVKGIENYIDSAITVLEKRDDVAFLIVGPDEDKELADSLKQRIQSLNLSQNIVFTGVRKDIPSILRESDIFVCSSKTEGLPYSCLEAMAASKPVVTTKCGGPEEIVINGVNGFHVNIGNPF